MKQKVLIVEDVFIEANNLRMILERAGHTVCTIANSVSEAKIILAKESPEIVLLDIFLKGKETGIDLAHELRREGIAFIFLSANSNKEILDAAKATQPYGFLVKPFWEKDVLVALDIASYLHENGLEAKLRRNPNFISQKKNNTGTGLADAGVSIVGKSKALQEVMSLVQAVAPADTSVLILGESGTGKERIADAIHNLSPRLNAPFIKVNCATLPANLIESELFGHEKGAFTGATERRKGKFEQAIGGTIFLDEIGELPIDLQSKLLRVLQEKKIEPLGGRQPIEINARIIAATNRNLEKEIAEGKFRLDLYYRLNVFPIVVPPLRHRKEDIPELIDYFIQVQSRRLNKEARPISDNAMQQLLGYSWPGNIRELENLMERNQLLSKGSVIENYFTPQQSQVIVKEEHQAMKTLEENEREHILAALKKTNGKIFGETGAAKILGMNVSTLNARIKKLGIEKKNVLGLTGVSLFKTKTVTRLHLSSQRDLTSSLFFYSHIFLNVLPLP